jgi:uncharacterized protein
MSGLLDRDIHYILKALNSFEEVERGVLFGSRAMGNYKKGSDVDLAIIGEKVSDRVIYNLDELLNEVYPLPYFFDILHYEKINNEKLKEHINIVGKELYRKGEKQKVDGNLPIDKI